jgi:predicted ArsR family transcriptional regulator
VLLRDHQYERLIVTSRKPQTSARNGRPPKGYVLSEAERQARRREKVETEKAQFALALFKAKDAGDWAAVEAVARSLLRL